MHAAQFIDARPPAAAFYRADRRADWNFGPMAGRSPAMQQLFSQMRHTARHLRVAAIEGESGTGKMLAARALHEVGLDPPAPFVPCPAAEFLDARNWMTVAESRGAAGAEFSAIPALRQACGGTLALTRVDELSASQQARLLEFLQWIDYQHIQRALGSIPRQILCLSGQSLRKLAASAALRADLASRLTTIRFALPPLRERREDIPLLAELFARQFSAMHGKPVRGLGPQTLPRLVQHSWPGNVRELESAIHAAALSCQGQWIRPIDLPALKVAPIMPAAQPALRAATPEDDPNLDRAILRHIQRVLARVEGNKLRAAKMLGISRSTLYRLLDSASVPSAS